MVGLICLKKFSTLIKLFPNNYSKLTEHFSVVGKELSENEVFNHAVPVEWS